MAAKELQELQSMFVNIFIVTVVTSTLAIFTLAHLTPARIALFLLCYTYGVYTCIYYQEIFQNLINSFVEE